MYDKLPTYTDYMTMTAGELEQEYKTLFSTTRTDLTSAEWMERMGFIQVMQDVRDAEEGLSYAERRLAALQGRIQHMLREHPAAQVKP